MSYMVHPIFLPLFPLSGMMCCPQLLHRLIWYFHPTLYLIFFFHSSSPPAFLTSILTQSSHLSLGLPRLLLSSSRNSAALFGSLASAILSTCPANCSLLLTSLSVKLLCTPVSSLKSTILLVSALVTLAIFLTQLFSHTVWMWNMDNKKKCVKGLRQLKCGRIDECSWTMIITNQEVLRRVQLKKACLLAHIRKKKMGCFGHIIRHSTIQHALL